MTRRLPAEWEPQSAIMLTWPHEGTDWAYQLAETERVYRHLVALIAEREHVLIVCRDQHLQTRLQQELSQVADPQKLFFHIAPSNDSWARDHGPITIFENQRPRLLDFRFDGWGKKYAAEKDDALAASMAAFLHQPCENINLILEGGSIETDGQGQLLTTTRCLLDGIRNPGWTKAEAEKALKKTLGITNILWLEHGELMGDDTDAHIDTLARFVNPTTIVYQGCERAEDPHYPALQAMREQLEGFKTSSGAAYDVLALPFPEACFNTAGDRLPATYANFLFINDAVLVPTYDVSQDQQALDLLQNLIPERDVIGVPCRRLIEQFGSLHCISMQLPEGVIS